MSWIKFSDRLPDELQTVWLCNPETQSVALGCIAPGEGGYCFAVSNGIIYAENGAIVSECEMDDYDFTLWHELPQLPKPE